VRVNGLHVRMRSRAARRKIRYSPGCFFFFYYYFFVRRAGFPVRPDIVGFSVRGYGSRNTVNALPMVPVAGSFRSDDHENYSVSDRNGHFFHLSGTRAHLHVHYGVDVSIEARGFRPRFLRRADRRATVKANSAQVLRSIT
jgi:hypothetical protein